MDGPSRIVFALLLAVASSAAAAPVAPAQPTVDEPTPVSNQAVAGSASGQPSVSPTTNRPVVDRANSTSYLELPHDRLRTARFGVVAIDAGGSMAVDNANIHDRYTKKRLRQAFTAARDDPIEQRAVVNRTTDRVAEKVADLRERERQALANYNAGRISAQTYLRELAAIDAAARSLETTIGQLYTYDRAADLPVPRTQIARLKAKLVPLTGPVREQVRHAMAGETDPVRVYVETSETGVVLSSLSTGGFSTEYVREAYYGDGLDQRWTDKPITIDQFENRLSELYPWTTTNKENADSALTSEPYYSRAGIYGIAYNHPHGTVSDRDLVVYYDAGTTEIFREVQRLDVSTVPTRTIANRTDSGLRLRLHTTYPGGPLLIDVTRASTGEPVDAVVELNGERVGTTQGTQLWTVAPRGSFSVTATSGAGNVTSTTNL